MMTWREAHDTLGCPGCKLADQRKLYYHFCCTHPAGSLRREDGSCYRRRGKDVAGTTNDSLSGRIAKLKASFMSKNIREPTILYLGREEAKEFDKIYPRSKKK